MYYFDGLRTVCFSLNLECNVIEGRKESSRNPGWINTEKCQGLQRVLLSNLLCQWPVDQNTLLFRTYIWQNAEARRDSRPKSQSLIKLLGNVVPWWFADGGVTSGFRGAIFFGSLLCLAGEFMSGLQRIQRSYFCFQEGIKTVEVFRAHACPKYHLQTSGVWLSIQVLKLARKTHCAQKCFFRFVCIS